MRFEEREVLRRARSLIATPEHWTQGAMARDSEGIPMMSVTSPQACSFCLVGAINRAAIEIAGRSRGIILAVRTKQGLKSESGVASLVIFNDSHSHSAVLQLLGEQK